jgi:hypothetical protein
MVDIMAEQMSAEVGQAGDRAAADSTQVEAAAEGAVAPIPQTVTAPGISAGSAIVRTEVLPVPAGGNGLGEAIARGGGRSRKRTYSMLLVLGYVLALLGFALVFVVPKIKSGWVGKALLIFSGLLLVGGAVAVSLGLVRETMRRL